MNVVYIEDFLTEDGWWQESSLWADELTPDIVERPTELEAVKNVFYEARALSGKMRAVLSDLEKVIYDYDLECKRKAPHMHTTKDRIGWILDNIQRRRLGLHLTFWQVHGILEEIDIINHNMAMLEHIELQASKRQAAKEIAFDILAESVESAA